MITEEMLRKLISSLGTQMEIRDVSELAPGIFGVKVLQGRDTFVVYWYDKTEVCLHSSKGLARGDDPRVRLRLEEITIVAFCGTQMQGVYLRPALLEIEQNISMNVARQMLKRKDGEEIAWHENPRPVEVS